MKKFTMFVFIAMFIFLTGCGGANEVSANVQPCNLSSLKIKEVKIKGDKEGFVTRAVKSELYKFGAKASPNGVEIVGYLVWSATGAPLQLSLEVSSMSFASVAENRKPLMGVVYGSRRIGREVAIDFCKCLVVTTPSRFQPTQK